MVFKEVNPETWKPEKEGDFIEGILVTKQDNIGENKSKIYSLEISPAKFISVWGCTILDQRMEYVKEGSKIRITYKGLSEQTSKGKNPAKIFKVEVDTEEEKTEEKSD